MHRSHYPFMRSSRCLSTIKQAFSCWSLDHYSRLKRKKLLVSCSSPGLFGLPEKLLCTLSRPEGDGRRSQYTLPCCKTTGRQKEPLFWTETGRGRCIYPQRPLLLFNASADGISSSCFAQTTTLVAVLPPIIQHHIPQTTGVPAVPAD
jgi:hypothetical protein